MTTILTLPAACPVALYVAHDLVPALRYAARCLWRRR